MPMKRDKVGILLVLMLLVGVCVLLYPALSQYWNSKTQTRAVESYQNALNSITDDSYSEYFEEAELYNERLAQMNDPLSEGSALEEYDELLNVSGTGVMGYITISKLGVELPIYHGVSAEVLNIACGHVEGSSMPIGGESTHSVLSAHRGLPHARLFTDLDRMELGDIFTVTILDRVVTYQVDQIKVVEPNEVNDVQIIDGEDHCTLLTCTPYGVNSHRLLVRGTRIENAAPVLYVTSDAYMIDSLVATPVVAAPMILILLIVLMVRYNGKSKKPLISKEEEEWSREYLH